MLTSHLIYVYIAVSFQISVRFSHWIDDDGNDADDELSGDDVMDTGRVFDDFVRVDYYFAEIGLWLNKKYIKWIIKHITDHDIIS